jgi:hypothetical protein
MNKHDFWGNLMGAIYSKNDTKIDYFSKKMKNKDALAIVIRKATRRLKYFTRDNCIPEYKP